MWPPNLYQWLPYLNQSGPDNNMSHIHTNGPDHNVAPYICQWPWSWYDADHNVTPIKWPQYLQHAIAPIIMWPYKWCQYLHKCPRSYCGPDIFTSGPIIIWPYLAKKNDITALGLRRSTFDLVIFYTGPVRGFQNWYSTYFGSTFKMPGCFFQTARLFCLG